MEWTEETAHTLADRSGKLKMDSKTLGERIRELRLERNLSLRQLALRIRKSAPFLSDVELGRRFPSAIVLQAIADELGVGIDELERHDFRASVSTLKHLSQTDPRWGMALRTTAEQIEKGLTPDELVRKLTADDRGRRTQ